MSSPEPSQRSVADYIGLAKSALAKLKGADSVMDDTLEARIQKEEEIINYIAENNLLRSYGERPKEYGFGDLDSIVKSYKTLETLYKKVTHPQNVAIIDAIKRLKKQDKSGEAAVDVNRILQNKIPLGQRDKAISVYCEKLLEEFTAPSRAFTSTVNGRENLNYFKTFRPEDKMLHDYIASKKESINRINQYFSNEAGRTRKGDQEACNALLSISDDISATLKSVHSTEVGLVSRAIDGHRTEGNHYQADLISKALLATPLKERANVLTAPSLVLNALATNNKGVVFVDIRDPSRIDFVRAPHEYREATGQTIHENPEVNILAPEPGLVATDINTYERNRTASPAKRVITSDMPMMSPLASPSKASPSAASTTSRDDAASVSMSPEESVDAMFADVIDTVTTAAPNTTSQFKERLKAVEQTPVEIIRRSHDASGDITEEDLDKPNLGFDH